MKTSSYSDRIDAYQTTVDNLEADLAKYPGAGELFAELKTVLVDLRPAHGSVEEKRGGLRVAVKARRDLADRGRKAHRRLAALVGAHTGFDNPVLAIYGISPEDNTRRGKHLPKAKKKELAMAAAAMEAVAAVAAAKPPVTA